MSNATVNLWVVQIPARWLWKVASFFPRHLVGTPAVEQQITKLDVGIAGLKQHLGAITSVIHVLVGEASGSWDADKRERVQKHIANFTIVSQGLEDLKPSGNPISAIEINRLKQYTARLQSGGPLTPEEATDYHGLSEKVAHEYPQTDWVGDLLKLALFAFGVYALGKALETSEEG